MMKELQDHLTAAQDWCDHNGDHGTGYVNLTVDTLKYWYKLARITVYDMLMLSPYPEYIVLDVNRQFLMHHDMELNQGRTLYEIKCILDAEVKSFNVVGTEKGQMLEVIAEEAPWVLKLELSGNAM